MLTAPKTVLIAEDNAALRRVIGFALKGCGFEVTAAPDGAEAWRIAEGQTFDLVVTDQQMPHLTGVELVEQLRQSTTNAKTPVILLTAKGMELEADTLREQYGVSAMLHKPFSPSQLGALAEEMIGQLV
ncbi:Alkaline phosphatase synthesis transcriptional regulatory protein PhoP [Botrimarina colliarenosi]|uniref:Alkaline phosphatase synthesis transcriptional regulatory protein PhoP n=1 Tax=Botrimarina colliarenosi TaxID=2528001 RepID=A0A5C6ADF0_9BACT|nr:response regulator [Botrimarina colliarenosi]TWT98082.1 Alkaline phosphatase synthesis transcriptional regulatory protein PhoP [Botrimarina colliarenosi]